MADLALLAGGAQDRIDAAVAEGKEPSSTDLQLVKVFNNAMEEQEAGTAKTNVETEQIGHQMSRDIRKDLIDAGMSSIKYDKIKQEIESGKVKDAVSLREMARKENLTREEIKKIGAETGWIEAKAELTDQQTDKTFEEFKKLNDESIFRKENLTVESKKLKEELNALVMEGKKAKREERVWWPEYRQKMAEAKAKVDKIRSDIKVQESAEDRAIREEPFKNAYTLSKINTERADLEKKLAENKELGKETSSHDALNLKSLQGPLSNEEQAEYINSFKGDAQKVAREEMAGRALYWSNYLDTPTERYPDIKTKEHVRTMKAKEAKTAVKPIAEAAELFKLGESALDITAESVGLLDANIADAMRKLSDTAPEKARMALEQFHVIRLKILSGAAVTPQEFKRVAKATGQSTDNLATVVKGMREALIANFAKMEAYRQNSPYTFHEMYGNQFDAMKRKVYDAGVDLAAVQYASKHNVPPKEAKKKVIELGTVKKPHFLGEGPKPKPSQTEVDKVKNIPLFK